MMTAIAQVEARRDPFRGSVASVPRGVRAFFVVRKRRAGNRLSAGGDVSPRARRRKRREALTARGPTNMSSNLWPSGRTRPDRTEFAARRNTSSAS